ncbi:MAG: hypothetical protein E2O82_05085 [Betaproteobacteria bacterium]|nr:MAG: hypothetical protein E2O82_05085 [Betaproteobacteria bacterium]
MAFDVANIDSVVAWTAASKYADDGSLDFDSTGCMTNGTLAEQCDEFKEGTINAKVTMDIDPAALITLSVRFYLDSVMQAGDNAVLPYTDIDSVDNTNENVQAYDTGGQWIEHNNLGAAFIAQLGDLSGKCAVRLAATGTGSGNAKSKIGEVNINFTIKTFTVAGVTRDKDEAVLVSMEYQIFKITGLAPETWSLAASGISNGTTGAYTEELGRATYRGVVVKDVTPQVMDVNPPIILAEAGTDDIFVLGKFSGLANDDIVHVYQAGSEALPIGTGFAVDTDLHVVSQSGDTCKLATTQGGGAIDITTGGDCILVGKPETS